VAQAVGHLPWLHSETLSQKHQNQGLGGTAQLVDHLPSKHSRSLVQTPVQGRGYDKSDKSTCLASQKKKKPQNKSEGETEARLELSNT
jgi:hypothetical protein